MENPAFQEIYQNMSEHQHQVELFAWAAYARRFGFEQAAEWTAQHPNALSRKAMPMHTPVDPKLAPPLKWLHAIPNGGSRGDSRHTAAIVGSRMKAEGVKKGVADIFLPYPTRSTHGLYIELKTLTGKPSASQVEFAIDMIAADYDVVICRGYLEAIHTITDYLKERR